MGVTDGGRSAFTKTLATLKHCACPASSIRFTSPDAEGVTFATYPQSFPKLAWGLRPLLFGLASVI